MTWPSFFAASISAGVTGSGGGASAITRVENAVPASKTPAALEHARREIRDFSLAFPSGLVLARTDPASVSFIPAARTESIVDSLVAIAARLDSGLNGQT